jgi:hypothetical protein
MDERAKALLCDALRQALRTSPTDISAALGELDWLELLYTDEKLLFSALFEEHGYLGASVATM